MEKFTRITSVAAPLMQANIDTDTIIPMSRYVTAEIDTLHQFAFEPLRFNADGSENPNFVLNRRAFRGARILIVGPNFGCGSSRETAVWAIAGLGIRCIIAPGFGSIFYANCFQSGLLPVVLSLVTVEAFAVALSNAQARSFDQSIIRKNAERFSAARFRTEFKSTIDDALNLLAQN